MWRNKMPTSLTAWPASLVWGIGTGALTVISSNRLRFPNR